MCNQDKLRQKKDSYLTDWIACKLCIDLRYDTKVFPSHSLVGSACVWASNLTLSFWVKQKWPFFASLATPLEYSATADISES